MNWETTAASDLTPSQVSAWDELLKENSHYESPYYRPEYAQCVAEFLPNIEVAMLRDGSQLQAIFPFERGSNGLALPVGRELADYQGPIIRRDCALDAREMLRAAELNRWDFDHLFPCTGTMADYCWTTWTSPQLDFSTGADEYLSSLYAKRKHFRREMRRRERKLSREVGEVRVETQLSDPTMLDRLVEWKIEQYEKTNRRHPFHQDWIRDFLLSAMSRGGRQFRGNLAALYAGETVIAMEYAFQSESTSHLLINAYDMAYSTFSPGNMCTLKMVEACAAAGLTKIDLGKGIEGYKQLLKNREAVLGEGSIDLWLPRAILRRSFQQSRHRFLRSPMSAPVKRVARRGASKLPFLRQFLSMR